MPTICKQCGQPITRYVKDGPVWSWGLCGLCFDKECKAQEVTR